MGTWSHEPFGNDTACRWADGLAASRDLIYIEAALDRATAGEEGGEVAVAAAEVLAKLIGRAVARTDCPEAVDAWVGTIGAQAPSSLLQKACGALETVLIADSPLFCRWEGESRFEAWKAAVLALYESLSGARE